jgi:small subunit ribosomal protein S1
MRRTAFVFRMSTPETNEFPRPETTGAEAAADIQQDSSFGDILSQFEREHSQQSEDQPSSLEGVVLSVTADSALVDIGRKHEGILSLDAARVKPGDKVHVNIGGRDENGYYLLSVFKVVTPKDWSGLE